MGCSCGSYNNRAQCNSNCKQYINCSPNEINETTAMFSEMFHNLENNYPVNRSKCVAYGTNPRYYSAPHRPCSCCDKCYPCQ